MMLPCSAVLLNDRPEGLEQYEQRCSKSFSSFTKKNLNTEVKEKEINKKFGLTESSTQNTLHPKINFINNTHYNSYRLKKTTNGVESSSDYGGIGRGAALQKRLETHSLATPASASAPQHFLLSTSHEMDPSAALLKAPVAQQMAVMVGDVYRNASFRRSLQNIPNNSHESKGEKASGLERAMSQFTLHSKQETPRERNEGLVKWCPIDSVADAEKCDDFLDDNVPS